jgi:hypothetical protein
VHDALCRSPDGSLAKAADDDPIEIAKTAIKRLFIGTTPHRLY